MAKRQCCECHMIDTLEYDVCAGGYVCQNCGLVLDCESVELGDYDIEED